MTTSARARYTPHREVFSHDQRLADLCPLAARKAASLSQEARVERIYDDPRGRPSADESRLRTQRFLCLIADGMDAEQAAREAKIGPWRALRIVTESDFREIVQAIRATIDTLAA